ncbi:MAG: hypothetical protein AAFU33_22435 [Bacteroidota bacterium]
MRWGSSWLLCLVMWLGIACEAPVHHYQYGYFSQESRKPNAQERELLKSGQQLQKVYLPLFQVDWDWRQEAPVPLKSQKINYDVFPPHYVCVPIISGTGRMLDRLTPEDQDQLIEQMVLRIQSLTQKEKLQEILLQISWHSGNFPALSYLIEELRAKLDVRVGIVLPLHYLRFGNETGVPPADFAVLNLYDQLSLQVISEKESIISTGLIQPYLMGFSQYALPIEVAIPSGNWGLVIRNNEPMVILPSVRRALFDDPYAFRFLDEYLIKVQRDTYFQGLYLKKGDFIRIDVIRMTQLKETLRFIRPFIQTDTFQINLMQAGPEGQPPLFIDSLENWLSN